MTLLDCGCGNGQWIDFCKKKGVDAIGLTFSQEQVDEIKSKGGTTKPSAKSVAEVFPAEDVVLPEHVQKFMDALEAAKTLDELTTIGRNINESNLNGQEIDDVHREYLLKKFKARRGEIAS